MARKPKADIRRRDRYGRINPRGLYVQRGKKLVKVANLPPSEREQQRLISRVRNRNKVLRPTPSQPGQTVEPPPPPRLAESATVTRRPGVIHTWFKAAGSMVSDPSFDYKEHYNQGIMDEDIDQVEAASGFVVPAMFFSNQGALLGAVKFDGDVPLLDLITLLNDKLQFVGEERAGFDFRQVYSTWSYRYYVTETRGGETEILLEADDRFPR